MSPTGLRQCGRWVRACFLGAQTGMRLTNGEQYSDLGLIHLILLLLARKYRADFLATLSQTETASMRLLLLAAASLLAFPAHADNWKELKGAAKQAAAQKAEEELNLPQAAPAGARVYFIEPVNGAELSGPVRVVFGLSAMGVAPAGINQTGTGHHHLLIDDPAIDYTRPLPAGDQIRHFGGGQTETSIDLKPGTHTLQLLFGDWKHQPHNPPMLSDRITITVKAPASK